MPIDKTGTNPKEETGLRPPMPPVLKSKSAPASPASHKPDLQSHPSDPFNVVFDSDSDEDISDADDWISNAKVPTPKIKIHEGTQDKMLRKLHGLRQMPQNLARKRRSSMSPRKRNPFGGLSRRSASVDDSELSWNGSDRKKPGRPGQGATKRFGQRLKGFRQRVMRSGKQLSANLPNTKLATKFTKLYKSIPKQCAKGWRENYWRELSRFTKLTANGDDSFWESRIKTDLQRTRRFQVSGSVQETFEFGTHQTPEQLEDLVTASLKFLKASTDDILKTKFPTLPQNGRESLCTKAVNQALCSLCQEFINDPYFKLLKTCCEKHNLTPVTLKTPSTPKAPPGSTRKPWKNEVKVRFEGQQMLCTVSRVFTTVWLGNGDIEAKPADYLFGFKRDYSIDLLGGPAKILPPTWLGEHEGDHYEKRSSTRGQRGEAHTHIDKLKKAEQECYNEIVANPGLMVHRQSKLR